MGIAHCNFEVAEWMDPTGSLRMAGLIVVEPEGGELPQAGEYALEDGEIIPLDFED